MKSKQRHPIARSYLDGLAARGEFLFASHQLQASLGISTIAAKNALGRLARQKLVGSPARGLYVIVPPEYRSLGCIPAANFIPDLLARFGLSYYVGLLSAAQYHGAAHHRPQEFQVFLAKNRRPILCGRVRVAFLARKRLAEVPTQSFNTPNGTVLVSSTEATAIDLVGYPHRAGGLGNVATVLSELAEKLDPDKLPVVAATAPISWAQRLGYLLDQLGGGRKTRPLHEYVRRHAREATLLQPKSRGRARRDSKWKLDVNAKVEPEA